MNNLTQTSQDAKQAYLDRQAIEMLGVYQKADKSERIAVITHINSFLKIVPPEAKHFWLKFRREIEEIGKIK